MVVVRGWGFCDEFFKVLASWTCTSGVKVTALGSEALDCSSKAIEFLPSIQGPVKAAKDFSRPRKENTKL